MIYSIDRLETPINRGKSMAVEQQGQSGESDLRIISSHLSDGSTVYKVVVYTNGNRVEIEAPDCDMAVIIYHSLMASTEINVND